MAEGADAKKGPDQVEKLRTAFGLERVVLVGDRGMLTQTKIDLLKEYPGLGWISALRSQSIRNLMNTGQLRLSLFDERDLAEIFSPDFPGERLVACYNSLLTAERRRKREELLAATEKQLEKIRLETASRTKTPLTRDEILNLVWGYDSFVGERSIDRFVTTLRNKIEPDPHNPMFIHTVREIGYKFEPPQGA